MLKYSVAVYIYVFISCEELRCRSSYRYLRLIWVYFCYYIKVRNIAIIIYELDFYNKMQLYKTLTPCNNNVYDIRTVLIKRQTCIILQFKENKISVPQISGFIILIYVRVLNNSFSRRWPQFLESSVCAELKLC
jgi:hypothetical protein